jgi:hypothetical protein
MSTAKEELARLIEAQPEDSSREEIVRELAFHIMVERGLADSDAKRRHPRRLSWIARHHPISTLNCLER